MTEKTAATEPVTEWERIDAPGPEHVGPRFRSEDLSGVRVPAEIERLRATNARLNRRAQTAEAALHELTTTTGRGKSRAVAAEVWERCVGTHEAACSRAREAEAEVERLRAALDADDASPPQTRLERDLSDFHVDRVSEHPPPEIVALAAAITREAALRTAPREDEDDE